MKRLLAIAAVIVAALVVLVLGTGASDDDGGAYKIRAIFDNAGFLVEGEDVKASGVVIGAIDSLDVTPDKKAAVILRIDDPAFRDFKRDARCQVRVQSLLGEKYVACQPTQPKSANAEPAPPLRQIRDGPNKGQYLLPVSQTSSPVDLDMLNNIMRLPERQRLALIINEFGTGLAGNGDELRAAVRRANPALAEFDRVLKILADENRMLAQLAVDSDAALEPLARESRSISNFIAKAGATARATAERGDDLERNFELLPEFLRQLQPTMARLEQFSLDATPVFADLGAAAPALGQAVEQLAPFSTAALPTIKTFGDAADTTRTALVELRPHIQEIQRLGNAAQPLAADLATGLTSLKREHGIDRFMQTVLGFAGALNGYDQVSHYLRAHTIFDIGCMQYLTRANAVCEADFTFEDAAAATATTADVDDPTAAAASASVSQAGAAQQGLRLPQLALPAAEPQQPTDAAATAGEPAAADGGDSAAAGSAAAGAGEPAEDPRSGLLGYLLGSEAVR